MTELRIVSNDNMPQSLIDTNNYLLTGGISEVFNIAHTAWEANLAKVQSDPVMIVALCMLAQEEVNSRLAKIKELQVVEDGN